MIGELYELFMAHSAIRIAANVLLILVLTFVVARIMNFILAKSFKRLTRIRIDKTHLVVLRRLIVFIIYVVGIIIAVSVIPGVRTVGYSMLASAGVAAIVIGFAAQQTFANIIAGIAIAVFEPFRVGDRIDVLGNYGTVEDITLRHTVINTWKNERIVIPNSKISEDSVINYTIADPKILETLEIGISYDSDIDKARKIMLQEARKHENVLKSIPGKGSDLLTKEEVISVRLTALADFSQNLRLYFWVKDKPTATRTRFELTESIKKRFDRAGIEIPFPYRTIVYKKDLEKKK